ncbi:MAG: hypothetical protein ACXWPM_06100 [Bdellovibrionota bacterium]
MTEFPTEAVTSVRLRQPISIPRDGEFQNIFNYDSGVNYEFLKARNLVNGDVDADTHFGCDLELKHTSIQARVIDPRAYKIRGKAGMIVFRPDGYDSGFPGTMLEFPVADKAVQKISCQVGMWSPEVDRGKTIQAFLATLQRQGIELRLDSSVKIIDCNKPVEAAHFTQQTIESLSTDGNMLAVKYPFASANKTKSALSSEAELDSVLPEELAGSKAFSGS